MTTDYSEQFQNVVGLSGFNYLTAGTQPSEVGVARARPNNLHVWTPSNWTREDQRKFGMWEIEAFDFSQQGLNHPSGLFSENSNGIAAAEMVTSSRNELFGVPEFTTYGSPDPSGTPAGIHSAFIFDRLFVGADAGANVSLWKETSPTDPTPSALTYTPAGTICSLTYVLDDGSPRLAVGEIAAPVRLLSDASATVATTMHSTTNSCWGIIMSGVNAVDPGVPVMLIYAGTTIGTKATNADLTTAISGTQSGLNAGGFAIGVIHPKGRDQRAYWAIPVETKTGGALIRGSATKMRAWSTNMEGGDLLPFESIYMPGGFYQAAPYRDGFVYTDFQIVCYWDGEREYNLNIFARRPGYNTASAIPTSVTMNSDYTRQALNLIVSGPDLYAVVTVRNSDGSAVTAQVEKYNYEQGSWHPFSNVLTTAINLNLYSGSVPLSPNTKRAFVSPHQAGNDKDWYAFYIPSAGESLLWQRSVGAGSVTTGFPTYKDGTLLTCAWLLDNIEYNPKVVTHIDFFGDLNTGDSGSSTTIQVLGRGQDGAVKTAASEVFTKGAVYADYRRKNKGWVNIHDIWFYITSAPTGTGKIVNSVPFTVRGIYSKDGSLITETNCPREFAVRQV